MRSAGVNFLGGPTSGEDDAFELSSSDIVQNAAMFWKGAHREGLELFSDKAVGRDLGKVTRDAALATSEVSVISEGLHACLLSSCHM